MPQGRRLVQAALSSRMKRSVADVSDVADLSVTPWQGRTNTRSRRTRVRRPVRHVLERALTAMNRSVRVVGLQAGPVGPH